MALTVVCSVLVAIGISKAASSFSASMRGASAKNREAASPSAQEDLEKKGSPSTAEKLNAAVTAPEVAKTAARAAAHAAEVNAVLPEEHLSILFERMALSQPEKVAVREADGSVELTYGDLLTTARRGADALRAVGLRSGDLVGLMVGPSVKGTAGILSIVLGGGAYVPLDPKYPPEWMSRVIEGAQIRLVATAPTYSDKAKERAAWLTEAWPTVTAVQVELHRNTDSALAPINEAKLRALHSTGTEKTLNTVLFTSGSTGTPKGVPSYETGVLSLARYFTSAFPYAQQEAVINHITYGWNDHKYQFWHPLLHGKEIVVVPDTEALVRMIDSPPRTCTSSSRFLRSSMRCSASWNSEESKEEERTGVCRLPSSPLSLPQERHLHRRWSSAIAHWSLTAPLSAHLASLRLRARPQSQSTTRRVQSMAKLLLDIRVHPLRTAFDRWRAASGLALPA